MFGNITWFWSRESCPMKKLYGSCSSSRCGPSISDAAGVARWQWMSTVGNGVITEPPFRKWPLGPR